MKKIRVGVLGYGNLGKSIESLLANDERFSLVAVFSKRNIKARFAKAEFAKDMAKYAGKIDIMFLCGGSSSNLMEQASEALKYFNCIDAFDTHKKIPEHVKNCNLLARQYKKVAFCSFGWDPGLFSQMRVLFSALGLKPYTIWGRGVSQGHSEALRCIKGVKDAVQYTVPNEKLVKKLKQGKISELQDEKSLHVRECFIVAPAKDRKAIVKKVIGMPNYFKGYKTKIKFIDEVEMLKHKKLFHAGQVFTLGGELAFSLKIDSNPDFTAKVLIAYARVLHNYYLSQSYGAYTILDIPFSHLLGSSLKFV